MHSSSIEYETLALRRSSPKDRIRGKENGNLGNGHNIESPEYIPCFEMLSIFTAMFLLDYSTSLLNL